MRVIAILFIGGYGGYDVSVFRLVIIMVLALITSMGLTAAPGAVILFLILSGMGFTGEQALIACTLILVINRPIEMRVNSLNCVGDYMLAIAVGKSDGKQNVDIYNK